MVGEIRDLETAEIAIKAAQTGHLVLSTLHTNDAPQTLTRLIDMGVKPYAIATSVSLIIAQRLARRLCSHCKQPIDIPARGAAQGGLHRGCDIAAALKIYAPQGLLELHRRLQGPRRHLPGHAGHRGDRRASSWPEAARSTSATRRPRKASGTCGALGLEKVKHGRDQPRRSQQRHHRVTQGRN